MLIDSPRLTDEDRAVWDLRERDDERLARSRRLDWMTAQARTRIAAFGRASVSVSWGKDSTVTAHLVRSVWPDALLAWGRFAGRDNPDSERVRDEFLAGWPMPYMEVACPWSDAWPAAMERAVGARRYTGIRAAESSSRRISAAVHGVSTPNVCRPILHWPAADVWAYLRRHDLPVHPAYAMSEGGRRDRDWLRVDVIGGDDGADMGRADWERRYYPDVLERVVRASQPPTAP